MHNSADDTPTGKGVTNSGGMYLVACPSVPLAVHRRRGGCSVTAVRAIRRKIPGDLDEESAMIKQTMTNLELTILLNCFADAGRAERIDDLPPKRAAFVQAIVADLSEAFGMFNVRCTPDITNYI